MLVTPTHPLTCSLSASSTHPGLCVKWFLLFRDYYWIEPWKEQRTKLVSDCCCDSAWWWRLLPLCTGTKYLLLLSPYSPDEDCAQGRIYLFRWTYFVMAKFRAGAIQQLVNNIVLRSFEMSNQRAKNITTSATSHSFILIIIMITRYKDEWIANREILIITPATLCDGGTLGDIFTQLKLLNQDSQQR